MLDLRQLTRLTALAVATGLLVAACGGSTASSSPAASSGTSAAPSVEAPSAEASEAPASEAPAESAEASVGALPSFDLEALTGAIPGVDSYRTSTSVGGVKQYESVVVTKPELSKAITVYDDQGKVSNRYVIIGKDAWQADGADGAFNSVPSQLATSFLVAFDPAIMLGAYAKLDWAKVATNQGVEDKNGVQAHHVRIDSTSFLGAAGAMPAGAAIDVWVADAGYLIAWEMTGFPNDANFAIEVTNVNDPSNKVEKPS
ncbi:MAG: hypothetical protein HY262_11660 [Chloroflexi bacterium]|nr:hypothetical protein [Chloroflexota bacterium]